MRSPRSASPISTCRSRRSRCGERFGARGSDLRQLEPEHLRGVGRSLARMSEATCGTSPDIAAYIRAASRFAGTAGQARTLSFPENARGTRRTNMIKCWVAVAALVVSGGFALAETQEMRGPPSAQQGTAPAAAPQSQPRLDAEGYNMDKPAPPATTGPVKKNPDPSAA